MKTKHFTWIFGVLLALFATFETDKSWRLVFLLISCMSFFTTIILQELENKK